MNYTCKVCEVDLLLMLIEAWEETTTVRKGNDIIHWVENVRVGVKMKKKYEETKYCFQSMKLRRNQRVCYSHEVAANERVRG